MTSLVDPADRFIFVLVKVVKDIQFGVQHEQYPFIIGCLCFRMFALHSMLLTHAYPTNNFRANFSVGYKDIFQKFKNVYLKNKYIKVNYANNNKQ